MKDTITMLLLLQVLIAGALSMPQGTKNASHPLKWLKPLEVARNQQEKTNYTSNPISDAQPNIIGGTPAILEQIPHQAFVAIDGSSFCGGALINFFWVLTAAHCVYRHTIFVVTLGTIDRNLDYEPTRWTSVVTTSTIHPLYDPDNSVNDIALLKMYQQVSYSTYIYPIVLPRYQDVNETFVGFSATVSGWGRPANNIDKSSKLLYVQVPIISNAECKRTFGSSAIVPSMVCTSGAGRRSTCFGDSGGPLTAVIGGLTRLAGIVSFGPWDCELSMPVVYTRVSAYLTWINQKTSILITP